MYQRGLNNGTHGDRVPTLKIRLPSDVDDVGGIWSDGETMWVVDDEANTKIHAMHFLGFRHTADEIDVSDVAMPAGLWTDGETMWVLYTNDKHAYAYDLPNGNRKKSLEFWTVPDNDDPAGGLTGHALRFWVVDGDDQKLYAYGGRNTPPSFGGATASFEFHRSLVEGDYIGNVPQVEDPDEDEVDYLLTSGTFGVFRLDSETGELVVKDGASAFNGGESCTLTVSVTDGRNRLDALDGDMDDAIDSPVKVITNHDPEFTTAGGTVFTVAEDAARGDIVADLEITDLNDDSLCYEFWVNPASPFELAQDDVKVSNPEDLNYESTNS